MSQPTVYDVHADRPLTSISVAYMQDAKNFIAQQAFPVIMSDKKSDSYYSYTQADWFRDEARPRADTAESAGSGYNVSTATYNCNVYAIHKDVGDQVLANADSPLNPMADATRFITQKMLLTQEAKWVADYFTSDLWGNTVTGGTNFTQWSNYATSDPVEDIEAGKETILQNTGYEANTLVMGYQAFRKLKHHPDILDRMKYTMNLTVPANQVGPQTLAGLFGVDRILVAKAVQNSAVENATDSYSFFHGKHALLMYVAPRPSLLEATAGYTFVWKGVSDGLGSQIGITRFRMNNLRAERVEAQMAWDNKLVASNLGYFYSGSVA